MVIFIQTFFKQNYVDHDIRLDFDTDLQEFDNNYFIKAGVDTDLTEADDANDIKASANTDAGSDVS
jgi:hypothetical protein